MALSLRDHLFLLPLLILLLCIPPWFSAFSKQFVNGDGNLMEQACNKTIAPNLCMACLEPDHRSDKADLKALIKIIIECGIAQALVMAKYVEKLARHADNVHQKFVLNNCYPLFLETVYHLGQGSNILYQNNCVGARKELRAAERQIYVCLDQFREFPRLRVPHNLLSQMLEFESLGQIINRLISVLDRVLV